MTVAELFANLIFLFVVFGNVLATEDRQKQIMLLLCAILVAIVFQKRDKTKQ